MRKPRSRRCRQSHAVLLGSRHRLRAGRIIGKATHERPSLFAGNKAVAVCQGSVLPRLVLLRDPDSPAFRGFGFRAGIGDCTSNIALRLLFLHLVHCAGHARLFSPIGRKVPTRTYWHCPYQKNKCQRHLHAEDPILASIAERLRQSSTRCLRVARPPRCASTEL